MLAEQLLDGERLGRIVDRRGRAVGVDVVDLLRLDRRPCASAIASTRMRAVAVFGLAGEVDTRPADRP